MKNTILLLLFILIGAVTFGQVGINTANPDPAIALEVIGDVRIDGSLFLEDPRSKLQIRNSKLLIQTTSNEIIRYDIAISKYGPINYAQFVFEDLSKDGLQDYNTKIDVDDYIVTIQGYYFLEAGTGDTDVMTHSNTHSDDIEGYQIYAYPNSTTNTWYIRAFINNATFRTRLPSDMADTPVDMYLNVVIYRKGFISKELTEVTVDMGSSETGTAPLPSGF